MNLRTLFGHLTVGMLGALVCMPATAEVKIGLDAGNRGTKIGDLHYGIFYEEINHAGDGGLYAELVKNRSFEDSTTPEAWSKSDGTSWKLVTADLLNEAQGKALEVTFSNSGDYISNTGFWGINTEAGKEYKLNFWARSESGFSGTITATLVEETSDSDGNTTEKVLGSTQVAVSANGSWQKFSGVITPTESYSKAKLRLTTSKAGVLTLDVVSLFPPTFKNRENGCRIDLAEKLEAMKPSFVRFPGGCYIEGTSRDGSYNRFEWKKTIGNIETRPGHYNVNWNYRVTDGLGFHELLQLSEDLGAEPLFVVNIGMGHYWTQPYDDIDEYIQEALDAIEYCNGDVTTKWGALRAANGHPEPFGLRLMEIGNENYQADSSQQSDHYAERYRAFYNAIKAVYPEMLLIGNVESWGTDSPSWRNNNPVEAVDEHYYRSPEWFANTYFKYDSYSRKGPKIYAGEYAVTSDFGTTGTLRAALGEAIYMLGMERNSDICVMNSYAPIFVNENDQCWKPDMIRFNSIDSYGTPSYYVQKLFPNNVGKENIVWTDENNNNETGHRIGFSTWSTTAEFDNVKVSDKNGNVIYTEDFSTTPSDWTIPSDWSVEDGVLKQTNSDAQGVIAVNGTDIPDDFVFEFDAKKTSGVEGFLVAFNYGSENDYIWWNVAGWSNTQHAIEISRNGSKSQYGTTSGSIETGKTYHGKIALTGTSLQCWLDDQLIHDITLPTQKKLYISSNIDETDGTLYCKVVNMTSSSEDAVITLNNAKFISGESTILTSGDSEDENTTEDMTKVAPATGSVTTTATEATFNAPAYSLTILKFKVSDITRSNATPLTSAELATLRSEFSGLEKRLQHLRSGAELPRRTDSGAEVEWSLSGDAASELTINEDAWNSQLTVSALGNTEKAAGKLVASFTTSEGKYGSLEFPITLAPTDDKYGYLYCYMNSSKEITNYALGTKEDKGFKFNQLFNGAEIFDTEELASIEQGTRDAYMQHGVKENEYFITTTDMCNAKSGIWFNYGIDLLRSKDMMHWESSVFDFRNGKKIFSDPEATTDLYSTDEEYANINRVWAPQFIWDATAFNGQGGYLVYYSVLSSNEGDDHDRIVYSYADKDFKTLTQPRVFYDPGYSVIDGDIVYNDYDGLYHMYLKHEGASGSDRGIYELTSSALLGESWTQIAHITNEGSESVEGSSTVRRIDEDDWNVYYMRYSGGSAYRVCESDHEGLNISQACDVDGTGSFQHGSILTVNEDEYKMLAAWDELLTLVDYAKAADSSVFTEGLAKAEEAMKATTVTSLLSGMTEAIEMLKSASETYMRQTVEAAEDGNITSLLVNPDFSSNNGNGWSGTSFTATSSGVAEHWNKTFDTYQELYLMPAGYYTLKCSGFYRNGNKEAYTYHQEGSEKLLASLYINDASTPFMSLYDDSVNYTYSPSYTYPDGVTGANRAFNTDNNYGNNKVTYKLSEVGTLRLGVKKSESQANDWTCFDNFQLFYSKDLTTVSSTTLTPNNAVVNVYSSTGILVKRNVNAKDATKDLAPGLYIIGTQKVIITK